MNRCSIIFSLTLTIASFFLTTAYAEIRTALVIGNSGYLKNPLKNPVNDAQDIANVLRKLGFNVTLKTDLSRKALRHAIREFGETIKKGGIGLFYFAGHGLQIKGKNYLLPIGMDILNEDEVEDEAVNADLILRKMESAQNKMNIVILDACRNNPFSRSFRSVENGLARMEGAPGSIIAFATAPRSIAADGSGRNGIYTKHLITEIQTPNITIEEVFKKVRVKVEKESDGKQIPWESSSLRENFYFNKQSSGPSRSIQIVSNTPVTSPVSISTRSSAEIVFWESIKDSQNAAYFKAYLDKYPTGLYAGIANIKLSELKPHQITTFPLSIKTNPENANIRILNIRPKYHDGLLLKPGSYHIEVTKPGYQKYKQWITLKNRPLEHPITLTKIQNDDMTHTSTAPIKTETAIKQGYNSYPYNLDETQRKNLKKANRLFKKVSAKFNHFQSKKIILKVPNQVNNGQIVPIKTRYLGKTKGTFWVFSDANNIPYVGHLIYYKTMKTYHLTTQIKMEKSGNIMVVYKNENGKFHAAMSRINIQEGARLKSQRAISFSASVSDKNKGNIRLSTRSPMYKNAYIKKIDLFAHHHLIASFHTTPYLSKNPRIGIRVPFRARQISVKVYGNDGLIRQFH